MSLLATLSTDASIQSETDSVGGSSGPLESGLYNCTVSMAYITKSSGGAMGLVLALKTEQGREIRQTLWMTSGTAKGCKNYYETKDGEKKFLPGFNHANALSLLSVGKEISTLDTETKVVNVYSPEAKAEVPTKVEVIMDLLGKEITVGLIKQTVDKTKKNDATGAYEPTGETREENEIDKLFRTSDHLTTAEIRASANDASFYNTWNTKWSGKTKDKTSKDAVANSGTVGAPKAPTTKKPATSLFG